MTNLPTVGGDANNWGTILNDYLQQALASDGTLVTGGTNTWTSQPNTNLASTSQPGLVELAGDLSNTATSPTVIGLQGYSIDSARTKRRQCSNLECQWQPVAAGRTQRWW